jgi:hypothetical protein
MSKLNILFSEKMMLAMYIAEYIQEELDRGMHPNDLNAYVVAMAIDAFEGGAADEGVET